MADHESRDLEQEAFDRYLHMYRKGQLTRREFMRIATVMAVSSIGAMTHADVAHAAPATPGAVAKDTITTAFDFDMPTLDPQMATLASLTSSSTNFLTRSCGATYRQ